VCGWGLISPVVHLVAGYYVVFLHGVMGGVRDHDAARSAVCGQKARGPPMAGAVGGPFFGMWIFGCYAGG
ncbi:hypothetical protein ABZ369_09165, partial [Streptomyces sp. NPDC005918]|uniref:hypothetical protein n=1 Tax=Streptomyces sp. NPDC005918 TaxID=3155454 RepID=UPI0033FB2B50